MENWHDGACPSRNGAGRLAAVDLASLEARARRAGPILPHLGGCTAGHCELRDAVLANASRASRPDDGVAGRNSTDRPHCRALAPIAETVAACGVNLSDPSRIWSSRTRCNEARAGR